MGMTIHSHLADFTAVKSIRLFDERSIEGIPSFDRASECALIEACAQIAAHHVRHQTGWDRHAFLLGIRDGSFSESDTEDRVMRAERTGESDRAFIYHAHARIDRLTFEGTLLIGTENYRDDDERKLFIEYYRGLWISFTKE
jgi:hypothetical protein